MVQFINLISQVMIAAGLLLDIWGALYLSATHIDRLQKWFGFESYIEQSDLILNSLLARRQEGYEKEYIADGNSSDRELDMMFFAATNYDGNEKILQELHEEHGNIFIQQDRMFSVGEKTTNKYKSSIDENLYRFIMEVVEQYGDTYFEPDSILFKSKLYSYIKTARRKANTGAKDWVDPGTLGNRMVDENLEPDVVFIEQGNCVRIEDVATEREFESWVRDYPAKICHYRGSIRLVFGFSLQFIAALIVLVS